jgi:hypothetical protein
VESNAFRDYGFADVTIGIRPRSVEIPQRNPRQAIGSASVRQHSLDEQFGVTIWIDRMLRMILRNWDGVRNAIGYAL